MDSAASPASSASHRPGSTRLWPIALIVLCGAICYANSLSAPFIFDDIDAIQENQTIRTLAGALAPPRDGSGVDSRPVVNLSLALNHALGGFAVAGYHATNVAIHLLAGVILYAAARRTLARRSPTTAASATPLALAVALLWTLHPLQTESVTVVTQRTESLMGLFYLLTLYGFIRSVTDPAPRWWQVFSVASCLLGMGTKEVMVSAPLMVMLYDRTFVAGTFRAAWQLRRGYYTALASTWLVLLALVASSGGARGGAAGAASGITPWSYALTQCEAIVRYLKLSIWPAPLVLDYGTGVAAGLHEVLPQALLVVFLVGATLVALWRRPAWGFLGAWFFVILAPSSSFLPLVTQTIAEHRMYLSLAAVVVAIVLAAHHWLGRIAVAGGLAVAAICGGLTVARNHEYRTAVAIWRDTTDKVPGNARAHSNLGLALGAEKRTDEAIAELREAIRLQPAIPFAHYNLGTILSGLNRDAEAVPQFEEELRRQPGYAPAWCELGLSLYDLGRAQESLSCYGKALELRPDYPEALERLGVALASLGRLPEAIARYGQALRLRPDAPGIHQNLGIALALSGRLDEAIAQFERAVALEPDFAEAHLALARALTDTGRTLEAEVHREKAQSILSRRGQ